MLIAEVQKNAKELVRVSIEDYKGHKFIDCRVYFEDGQGQWKPTKKGIALNAQCIDSVIEALRKARMQLINQNGETVNQVNRKRGRIDDAVLLSMLDRGEEQKEIAEHFGVSPAAVCKRIKQLLRKDEPERKENVA